ncbi:hypothetical protein BH10CYA1_BH10CYA1_47970 [soil metagenome]
MEAIAKVLHLQGLIQEDLDAVERANETVPQVENINGRQVMFWSGSMTGCQTKVKILEEHAKRHPNSEVWVIFNSFGGGVDDCLEAYNRMLLLRHFCKMRFVFVVLSAKSCALWFIQCADVRIALPHSTLMYHCLRWTLSGAKSSQEMLDADQAMNKRQAEFTQILCSRSENKDAMVEKVLQQIADGKDYSYSPVEAVQNGWMDLIYQPIFAPINQQEIDLTNLSLTGQVV